MKNKKSLSFVDTSNMTQFVANMPMELVITVLDSFPRFELKAVSSPVGRFTFEVRFNDSSSKVPIYLSLQPWNKTETLVTLSYYKPAQSLSFVLIMTGFVIASVMSVIGYWLFNSIALLAVIWGLAIILLIYSGMNGNTAMDEDYSFDATRLRTQEDLMGWIVADLQDSADLEIVEYSGKIERK